MLVRCLGFLLGGDVGFLLYGNVELVLYLIELMTFRIYITLGGIGALLHRFNDILNMYVHILKWYCFKNC